MGAYEKECIREESVGEGGPSCPATSAGASVQDLGNDKCDNHADEFVARVRN